MRADKKAAKDTVGSLKQKQQKLDQVAEDLAELYIVGVYI